MRIDLGAMLARDNLRKHASGPLGALALVLLCCTVYLPGFFSIPPVDRDESRFAQASRQMYESVALPQAERDPELHSGGLAVPMVGGKPRLNKPPLIYWLQAASATVFTGGDPLKDAIWMYRVPSLVAGLVIVLATWRIGCSMFDPRVGWVGACLLAVSPVFVWEAHQARADMAMVAWTVLGMGQFYNIWRTSGPLSRPRRERVGERAPSPPASYLPPLLLWAFIALGVLTKGPITLMVVVLAAAWLSVFSRDWRWLRTTRPLLGLVIVAAAVAPWVYAVAQQVGFANYWQIVYDEVFARAGSAKEGHWGPPGYHLVLLVVLFWPGSLLTGLSIGRAWRRGFMPRSGRGEGRRVGARLTEPWHSRVRRAPAYLAGLRATRRPEAFLIAWIIPSWTVFELVGTKLPHYTMPLYPAVALITARGLTSAIDGRLPGMSSISSRIGYGLWCLIMLLFVGASVLSLPHTWIFNDAAHYHRAPMLLLAAAGITATLAAYGAIRSILQGQWSAAYRRALVASIGVIVVLFNGVIQNQLGLTHRARDAVQQIDPGGERPIAFVDFFEDSIVFLWRARAEKIGASEIPEWLARHPAGIVLAPSFETLDSVAGVDRPVGIAMGSRYSKGESVALYMINGAESD